MNSEDTDVGVDRKYCFKIVIQCCNMDEYFQMIDNQQIQEAGFSQAGSRPIKCLQYLAALPLNHTAPTGLPEALYDQQWLASIDSDYCEVTLAVSKDKFK